MDQLAERISRAAESILDNESLTADLDDSAAKELLAWAVACAERIAASTVGLNQAAAEEAMYPRMRATRRLMRAVNGWLPQRRQMDHEGNQQALEAVIELATVIYGGDFSPPSKERRTGFLRLSLLAPSRQAVSDLRRLLEGRQRYGAREDGMTKRSTSGRSTRAGGMSLNRIITVVAMVVGGVLLLYYLFTGSDPLGLFTEPEPTPIRESGSGAAGVGWWRVYFTDPELINDPDDLSGSIPEELIALIDGAQRSIHIAAFEFDLTPVAERLIAAHQRGVEVRWVTDDEHGTEADEEEGHGQFAMLEKAGIEVIDDGRTGLMHNKFWIVDGRTVWTGSTNITANGNFRNNNNVIVIESPGLAAIYEREFGEMWVGEFGPTSTSTADKQSVTIEGSAIQVYFAAEDEVAERLVPLLEGARDSVRVMAFSFTQDEMGSALLERAGAGVDVRAIFESRGSETEYSELPRFYCAGVPVRQDGNPGTFHHKVLVIDGMTVVTGSFNFSQNADESNDENVLIVTNREIAAEYLQEFERRWEEASKPDAADVSCD